ncbi:MAG: hypothetical protein ACYC5N_08020 [Endomicrobiales bacterium]
MAQPSQQHIVRGLFRLYGHTFTGRLGIDLDGSRPDALFKLLMASELFSICVDRETMDSAYNLLDTIGWTQPERLMNTTFTQRINLLDEAGYLRDDKNAAAMIAELPPVVLERYNGDLNNLRGRAGKVPEKERRLLEEFRGIDEISADFFQQEIQLVWDENYPFAGGLALRGARKLGFDPDTRMLSRAVKREEFPRFVASLTRMEQENNHSRVFEEARTAEELVEV